MGTWPALSLARSPPCCAASGTMTLAASLSRTAPGPPPACAPDRPLVTYGSNLALHARLQHLNSWPSRLVRVLRCPLHIPRMQIMCSRFEMIRRLVLLTSELGLTSTRLVCAPMLCSHSLRSCSLSACGTGGLPSLGALGSAAALLSLCAMSDAAPPAAPTASNHLCNWTMREAEPQVCAVVHNSHKRKTAHHGLDCTMAWTCKANGSLVRCPSNDGAVVVLW